MGKNKKKIGILNKGNHNTFINNTFSGTDIGIQDEGEQTTVLGNEFKCAPILFVKWWEKTWFQLLMLFGGIASIVGLFFWFLPSKDVSQNSIDGVATILNSRSGWVPTTDDPIIIRGHKLADLSTTTIQNLFDKIRAEDKVRPLVELESGKKLADVPVLTYSFMYAGYLSFESFENYKKIFNGIVDRFNTYNNYFEIHKSGELGAYLLGFISEESYVNVNNSKSERTKNITIFPSPAIARDYLVWVPIEEIIKSTDREITLDDGSRVGVIDLILNLRDPITASGGASIANSLHDVVVPKENKWNDVWWGQIIIGLIITVVGGVVRRWFLVGSAKEGGSRVTSG